MSNLFLVTDPQYYKTSVKSRNFEDWAAMYERTTPEPLGLWEIKSVDVRTGEVIQRIWAKNVITDNGATSALKNNWNNAGSAVSIFNQICIATASGSTTLTAALASGTTYTTLSVQAIPAAIASGTSVTVGYGTAQTQTFVLSGAASLGATSLLVTSQSANANYAIGANVVPVPTTADNPSSNPTGAQFSGALGAGAFTFSGTGAGNRQVQIQYTFAAGSFTTGNYTDFYTANAGTIVSNSTASHLITVPTPLSNVTALTANIIEKL